MIEQGQTVLDETGNRFLRLCLRGRWDPAALQAAHALASRVDLDWDSLRKAVHSDALTPLLYCIVRDQKLVPPSVEGEWRRSYHLSLLHSTRSFHELGNVLRHLTAAGVTVILLKGAALVETVYGNVAVRPAMADWDLLVPTAEVAAAMAVVEDLGFTLYSSDRWPGFTRRYRYALSYHRPSGGKHTPRVDLHWSLLDVPYYERIPVEEWFDRAQPARVAGTEVLAPAPEDHLTFMCGHLALHHQYDLDLLRYHGMAMLIHYTGDGMDWDGVVQRAVDWRLVIPLQHTLARLENLWPGTVPAGVVQEVNALQPTRTERWIHRSVVDPGRTHTSNMLLSLITMPGLTRRVRFLLEVAFPSPAFMRQRYGRGSTTPWPLVYLHQVRLGLQHLLQHLRRSSPSS